MRNLAIVALILAVLAGVFAIVGTLGQAVVPLLIVSVILLAIAQMGIRV